MPSGAGAGVFSVARRVGWKRPEASPGSVEAVVVLRAEVVAFGLLLGPSKASSPAADPTPAPRRTQGSQLEGEFRLAVLPVLIFFMVPMGERMHPHRKAVSVP